MTTPLQNLEINTLGGVPTSLGEYGGRALLVVNVASKCGLTPQYTALEKLASEYADRGLTVIAASVQPVHGPGTGRPRRDPDLLLQPTYGFTFPLMEKVDVNGENRHPIYAELTETADADGEAGDIQWNFEKFLIAPDGTVVNRFPSAHRARRPRGDRGDRGRAAPIGGCATRAPFR